MGGQKKTGKGRLDKFYHLAKEQGYRSRASFKLVQLNKKFDFLSGARCCIDLCAAPGGWLQVASKYMPVSSLIVGIDLVPIRPIRNCITITEDITTASCRNAIRKHLKTWKADVVLHDGAPNVGKNWIHDAFSQSQLVLAALKLATEFLNEGGTFVTKVFRSQDYNALIYVMKKLFKNVQATKPKASRNASAEIFVVCQKYLAPKSIDPKFLDPKFAFEEVDDENATAPDVMNPKQSKRRKAKGYTTDKLIQGASFPVKEFLTTETPVQDLAKYDRIAFDKDDEEELRYLNDPDTTQEVLTCFGDLKVLGKRDFKQILKWRTALRKKYIKTEEAKKEEEEEESEDEEEKIDNELAGNIKMLASREKKKKKKDAVKRSRMRERAAMGMDAGTMISENDTQGLFNLTSIKTRKVLDVVGDLDYYVSPDEGEDSDIPLNEDLDYDEYLEGQLDRMYESYMERKGLEKKKDKKRRSLLKASGFDMGEGDDDGEEEDEREVSKTALAAASASAVDRDSDAEEEVGADEEKNPLLMVPKEEPVKVSRRTALWFDQPLFKDMLEDDGAEEEAAAEEEEAAAARAAAADSSESEDEGADKEGEEAEAAAAEAEEKPNKRRKTGEDTFEVVPQSAQWSDAEDLSDYDEDEVAQALALGQAMVDQSAGKIQWNRLIDDGYNRYTHGDQGSLPRWFMDEEREHNKPQAPVTKEQVNEIKARFMELNARPIKKIAEAKGRKKMKTMKRMEKLKEKANTIAANQEMSESAKMKELERLAKRQQMMGKRPRKQVVVRRNFQNGRPTGRGTKSVDRRMLKEKRATQAKEKKAGSRKRKR